MIKTIQDPMIAVVVPFYKIIFFEELLDALAKQTDKNFNVYIGDDCSLDDPTFLLEKYKNKLNIIYNRFDQRLGHISLTKQWDRCLKLTQDEDWIWIIPDDDLPSLNCVEAIKNAVSSSEVKDVNILRIPLKVINDKGFIIQEYSVPEKIESVYNFYINQLKGLGAGSTLGDNIFRKKVLIDCGGFVDFPKAWGSDHATVLKVSAGKSIYCIQDAYFCFRQSGLNISSQNDDGAVKMRSRVMFAYWLKENESIFTTELNADFYSYVYWKGEHYALNEWSFNIAVLWQLMRLRFACLGSVNPLPILWLLRNKLHQALLVR